MFARPHRKGKELGEVAHAHRSSNGGKLKIGGWPSRLTWAKK
jgi:hypothetical protein